MRGRLLPVIGFLLGLIFPIGSFLILAYENNLPLGSFAAVVGSLAQVHQLSGGTAAALTLTPNGGGAVQWLVDTMPLLLGLLGYWVSARQPQIAVLKDALQATQVQNQELASQVESLQASLQARVEAATAQLHTAAELAQQANLSGTGPNLFGRSGRQPEELMEHMVELISSRLGFYHVGVFLNDRENRYTVLQAANSAGGRRMLARGHRLAIGEMGMVGYVAGRGEARLALDVGQDAVYFDNPDLPETRSEMALPLRVASAHARSAAASPARARARARMQPPLAQARPAQSAERSRSPSAGGRGTAATIGVLDIQSTQSQAFDENDLAVAQIIADSLANAIENARLFAEVQASLAEIQDLHRQYTQRASWLAVSGDALEYEIQTAHTHTNAAAGSSPADASGRCLEVPIRLREQSIGKILLEAAPRQEAGQAALEWLPEELAMVEAITTQAGLALENARLLQETQRGAEQERLAAEITARLWASGDPHTILRTALKELADALGASDGLIQLEVRE